MLDLRRPSGVFRVKRASIVRVTVPDEQGKKQKARPVLILTNTGELRVHRKQITIACITHSPHDPGDDKYVELGTSGQPNSPTGLVERSWVNTQWMWIIEESQIESYYGKATPREVAAVIEKIMRDSDQVVHKAPMP